MKAPLYARAGVPETWVVLLSARTIEVHRGPTAGGSVDVRESGPDEMLSPLAFPDLRPPVRSILP